MSRVNVIQQLLTAGLVDEVHLDVLPLLLGDGLRVLPNLGPDPVRLELRRVERIGRRTRVQSGVGR